MVANNPRAIAWNPAQSVTLVMLIATAPMGASSRACGIA